MLVAAMVASTLTIDAEAAHAYGYRTVNGGNKYAAVQLRVAHDPSTSNWNLRRVVKTTHSGSRGGSTTNTSWSLRAVSAGLKPQNGSAQYSLNKNSSTDGFLGSGTNSNCTASTWSGCESDHYWWRLSSWQGKSLSTYLFGKTSTYTSGGNFTTTKTIKMFAGPWP